ncbi:Na(+)-translocating NADH-quinone reductase subunit B [Lentisphaera araneosa HTCC2155]|uniref:Na(+)-translocating NADH-quinone reductase subunit B n=1 Tax=Lentisphaera araneosa HTCC2155 TaxID=313628 RepID=A6DRQ1_9BACT|nr:NADH:ubiquinone reductase (Na(+)-transporting) subunit B [Lentisphaera araneosa]EDM25720.1 Na(+)-translocating NADH-quinone reductase subunit B [Lentisphaera araneosa HTCC2155]
MKFVEDQIHKVKPLFEKGGKLEKFYYLFEAGESFHLVTDKRTDRGAHVRDSIDLKRMMITVVLAMVPCILFGIYNTGLQHYSALLSDGQIEALPGMVDMIVYGAIMVVPVILTVYITGGIIEGIFACIRKHEINEGFLVTGILIAMVVPASIPLWQVSLATAFGVFIGKECFGGTGMNILNPAMTARAFLFFNFPSQISGDKVWVGFDRGQEVVATATPMGLAAKGDEITWSTMDMFLGFIPGSIGETSTLACIIGGIILLITGVASWRTMLGMLVGGFLFAWLISLGSTNPNDIAALGAVKHLCMGGFAFGLVFMATDPVSSANTDLGKWIYGFGAGAMSMLFRIINPAYPEGVMLAVLLMNVFAPLIDHYVVKSSIKRRLNRARV